VLAPVVLAPVVLALVVLRHALPPFIEYS